jgi:hypothetical protein
MKLKDVKTINQAQYFVEGVINDFEGGILNKEKVLEVLGKYTAHCMKIWQDNVIANPSLLGLKKDNQNK